MQNPFINFNKHSGNSRKTVIAVEPNDGRFYRKGEALIFKNGSFYGDAPTYEDAVKEARKMAKSIKPARLEKRPIQDQRNDVEEFVDQAEERLEETGEGFRGGGLWNGDF